MPKHRSETCNLFAAAARSKLGRAYATLASALEDVHEAHETNASLHRLTGPTERMQALKRAEDRLIQARALVQDAIATLAGLR